MDTINAGLFPISFNAHMIFTIISVLFFIFQYTKHKQKYQLLSAIAIPLPLILYLNSSAIIFNIIGIAELIMVIVIGAMLFSSDKKENKDKKVQAVSNNESAEKESTNNDKT